MSAITGSVTAVRSAFDEAALARYLGVPSLTVRQFEGGQSNPTYLLETPTGRLVLRKRPSGELLASAHMVEREYRIMAALAGSAVPMPDVPVFCEDPSIIGTPFFVMSYVEGRIIRDPALQEMPRPERRQAYVAAVETLAALHEVDFAARGLADFGKPSGYVSRQITRWTRQYHDAHPPQLDDMDWLLAWLPAHVPAEQPVAIAHGDYRIDNLVLHPTEPRVLAVLDWELSTLGDPLTDLAYFCMPYHLSREERGLRGLAGYDLAALGVPAETEVIAAYCARRAIATPPREVWAFYLAFGLFRMASILAGVAARVKQGNASSSNAGDLARQVPTFAATARRIAESA
jgi:aminoglycoside phosphotransferase (APT) family kinase protein